MIGFVFTRDYTNSDGERVRWYTYRKSSRGFQTPRYEPPLYGIRDKGMTTREYADSHGLSMEEARKELEEGVREGTIRKSGGGSSLRWFQK